MISVVLVEPENSGNVGSVARVMANFGFSNLILINPKCGIDVQARRFAKNAQKVLDASQCTTIDILDRFDLVVGTTRKLGTDYNIPRSPMTPRQLASKLSRVKSNVALVLGRESDGLRNTEIDKCDFLVSIPTSKNYPSMNLSHALAILLYEISLVENETDMLKPYTAMSVKEKKQIFELLNSALQNMDFLTDAKRATQVKVWKRMVTKSMLTKREAYALMGFLRKIRKL